MFFSIYIDYLGWRLYDAREEEIRELSVEEKTSKEIEEETPLNPGEESNSEFKGLTCSFCAFLKNVGERLKSCIARGGLFNKMSITEEEKKSIED